MLEIIKKITGTDDASKFRRNIENNARILKEFPWLWAVQNCWPLSHMVMRVANEDLTHFLSEPVTDHTGMSNDHLDGIWIHKTESFNGGPMELVETVWNGKDVIASIRDFPNQTWCQKLHSCIRTDHTQILHIAMMFWHGDAMVIYRPKPAPNFNFAISSCGVGEM